MTLSQIWIYPVKSLGGISLQSWYCLQKGFRFDRRWMLIDSEGKFITQRVNPTLALFKLSLSDNQIHIRFDQHSLMLDPVANYNGESIQTNVWDDSVSVNEVSIAHSAWFSEMLKEKVKLIYFPENNPRAVESLYQINKENVSLADAYPYLLIGQSSLDDLNSKLEEPVPMNRFRPNLVFTGGQPYEEDSWKGFTVGSHPFSGTKPCSRCILITTNQDTAKRSAEPLKTLASYRMRNNKTYFGQNVLTLSEGEIKVGDSVSVTSYQ